MNADLVLNPATRRMVKRDGPIGSALLAAAALVRQGVVLKDLFREKCPDGGAWDPTTGRCVRSAGDGRLAALMALADDSDANGRRRADRDRWEGEYAAQLSELHARRQELLAERQALNRNRRDFEARVRLFEAHHRMAGLDLGE